MDKKDALPLVLGGVAFLGIQAEEFHHEESGLAKLLATKPVADLHRFVMPHGNEPEQPTGPLQAPWATMYGTSTSTGVPSSPSGLPGLVVNLRPSGRVLRSSRAAYSREWSSSCFITYRST